VTYAEARTVIRLNAWRPCLHCGAVFLWRRRFPNQKFCGEKCSSERLDGQWRECEGCGASYQAAAQRVRKGEGLRFCSRSCAFDSPELWNAESMFTGARRRRDVYRSTLTILRRLTRCTVCEGWMDGANGKLYCSDGCKAQATNEQSRMLYHSRWVAPPPSTCSECGDDFQRQSPEDLRKVYCSAACRRRSENRKNYNRRRARRIKVRHGETISLRYVFLRDGKRCQICGDRTWMYKRQEDRERKPQQATR